MELLQSSIFVFHSRLSGFSEEPKADGSLICASPPYSSIRCFTDGRAASDDPATRPTLAPDADCYCIDWTILPRKERWCNALSTKNFEFSSVRRPKWRYLRVMKINHLSLFAVIAAFFAMPCNSESKLGGESARLDESVAVMFPTHPPHSNTDGVAVMFPTHPPRSSADDVAC